MLRIEKVIVICREVNRQTGQIAAYPSGISSPAHWTSLF